LNVPSTGPYHKYPGDNWRFYSDAGQALAYWSCFKLNDIFFPCKIIETFNVIGNNWNDYICVWKRTNDITKDIILNIDIINNIGILEKKINNYGYITIKNINIKIKEKNLLKNENKILKNENEILKNENKILKNKNGKLKNKNGKFKKKE
jgi:hypothetical protein